MSSCELHSAAPVWKRIFCGCFSAGEQTRTQQRKGSILFEEGSGWWAFSGYPAPVTTNDPLKRYRVTGGASNYNERRPNPGKTVVAVTSPLRRRNAAQPEVTCYHLLRCCWTIISIWSPSRAAINHPAVVQIPHCSPGPDRWGVILDFMTNSPWQKALNELKPAQHARFVSAWDDALPANALEVYRDF